MHVAPKKTRGRKKRLPRTEEEDSDDEDALYVKGGRYGLWTKSGFQPVSNFDLKIRTAVVSHKLGIRGYALQASKVDTDIVIDLFVPEAHVFITLK